MLGIEMTVEDLRELTRAEDFKACHLEVLRREVIAAASRAKLHNACGLLLMLPAITLPGAARTWGAYLTTWMVEFALTPPLARLHCAKVHSAANELLSALLCVAEARLAAEPQA